MITLRNHAPRSYTTWLPVTLTWLPVTLTWLLNNLQLWRHRREFRKLTVRFRPIRKEIVSSMYNNNTNLPINKVHIDIFWSIAIYNHHKNKINLEIIKVVLKKVSLKSRFKTVKWCYLTKLHKKAIPEKSSNTYPAPSGSKSTVFKMFLVHTRTKSKRFLKYLWFKKRFRKAPFFWRISVDGRPSPRNKAVFSIFYGVVQILPQSTIILLLS